MELNNIAVAVLALGLGGGLGYYAYWRKKRTIQNKGDVDIITDKGRQKINLANMRLDEMLANLDERSRQIAENTANLQKKLEERQSQERK